MSVSSGRFLRAFLRAEWHEVEMPDRSRRNTKTEDPQRNEGQGFVVQSLIRSVGHWLSSLEGIGLKYKSLNKAQVMLRSSRLQFELPLSSAIGNAEFDPSKTILVTSFVLESSQVVYEQSEARLHETRDNMSLLFPQLVSDCVCS